MNEKTYRYIGIAFILFFIICTASTIYSSIESYKSRRLCNQLRERIVDAEDTNRKLAGTIEQCQSICGELTESVDRNIHNAREAVELIEELRIQVQSLENQLGGFDWDNYYSYWDNYFGME